MRVLVAVLLAIALPSAARAYEVNASDGRFHMQVPDEVGRRVCGVVPKPADPPKECATLHFGTPSPQDAASFVGLAGVVEGSDLFMVTVMSTDAGPEPSDVTSAHTRVENLARGIEGTLPNGSHVDVADADLEHLYGVAKVTFALRVTYPAGSPFIRVASYVRGIELPAGHADYAVFVMGGAGNDAATDALADSIFATVTADPPVMSNPLAPSREAYQLGRAIGIALMFLVAVVLSAALLARDRRLKRLRADAEAKYGPMPPTPPP